MSHVILICPMCDSNFFKLRRHANEANKLGYKCFCSQKCYLKTRIRKIKCECKTCQITFYKEPSQIKKTSGNNFCCKSCAAKWNNCNKKFGTRKSKLEIFLQEKLLQEFDLEFEFNKKNIISSELDIYIPKLKLAFELNGIFHYKPIFGLAKFNDIQNNDRKKIEKCLEKNINLYIIDSSSMGNFKNENAEKYFEIVKGIIKQKLK